MAHILVADDEPDVRDLVRVALGRGAHTVAEAADGPAALEHLRAHAVDLLILDVMLPGMDGYTLQMRLAQDARTSRIPVIVLTAVHPTKGLFAKFPQVKDFVAKPFDPTDLERRVERVLAGTGR